MRERRRQKLAEYGRPIVTRKDRDNIEKGVINRKRIKQLHGFINEYTPKTSKEHYELHCLLIYGEIYIYGKRRRFTLDTEWFEGEDYRISQERGLDFRDKYLLTS